MQKKTAYFPTLLAFLVVAALSYLMLLGSGFFETPSVLDTLLLAFFLIYLNSSKKAFYFIALPFAVLYALYTPVGLTFGKPSYQYIASVFATDLLESKEFLSQLPIINYLAALAIIGLLLLFRKITQKYHIEFTHNRAFLVSSALVIFFSLTPFTFFKETYTSSMEVKKELERLNTMTIESQWGASSLNKNSKYDDYVLIIGESARKDYHHAYGYPVENTPFMSSAKGTLIDGLTAGGTNTIASLKLMLTKPNKEKWEGDYGFTLIDLVKSANFKTFWLSNHGYLGTYDTPISSIANKSDETIFLKKNDSLEDNVSDFELLPKFEQVIQQPHKGKRFIVVHLYGSHPITCDRLTDYPKIFKDDEIEKKYFNVNCYVSSIKKTDEVIEKIYTALRKNQQESHRLFSMIYFSDHGLSHKITEDNIVIHNSSGKSKLHFDIPLFKISSDDIKRQEFKAFKSGLNFTEGLANWLGIENSNANPEFDLFSNTPDKSDYGLKKILDEIEAPLDPAVPIKKLKEK